MSDLILVTGASGYVGKWCVVKLLEKGYRVRGTIRGAAKATQVRDTVTKTVGAEAGRGRYPGRQGLARGHAGRFGCAPRRHRRPRR